MVTRVPCSVREVLEINIEHSCRAFETLMATSAKAWVTPQAIWPLTDGLQPLGDKILKSFRDNAAAHFAFALKLAASKDASDALRLYGEHVEERVKTWSQQFQEISRLAVEMGAANKSEQLDDISSADKAAIRADNPTILTVPDTPPAGKAIAQSSHQGANGSLNSQVASARPSTQPRVANRGGKGKKPPKVQKAARPTEAGAARKLRKQRRPNGGATKGPLSHR